VTLFVSATSAAKLIEPDSLELVMVCGWNGTNQEKGYRNYSDVQYGSIIPANGLINGNTTPLIGMDQTTASLIVYLTYLVSGQTLPLDHFDTITISGTFAQGAGVLTLPTNTAVLNHDEAQGSFVTQWWWLQNAEVSTHHFVVGNSYDVVFNWTNT
jgi:hypothetical protein